MTGQANSRKDDADLIAVSTFLFGPGEVGPLELQATREVLRVHRLPPAEVAAWLSDGQG